mgnify:CR=1 FL=1
MANGHGGARRGAGKPRGAKRRITEEAIERAAEGETPLEYMLRIMRDKQQANDRRDKMAIAAASYMHPRAVEVSGPDGGALSVEVTRFADDTPAE